MQRCVGKLLLVVWKWCYFRTNISFSSQQAPFRKTFIALCLSRLALSSLPLLYYYTSRWLTRTIVVVCICTLGARDAMTDANNPSQGLFYWAIKIILKTLTFLARKQITFWVIQIVATPRHLMSDGEGGGCMVAFASGPFCWHTRTTSPAIMPMNGKLFKYWHTWSQN